MTQKVAAPLKRKKKSHLRKNMTEAKKRSSEVVEKYPGLLKIIEEKMQKNREKSTAMILKKYPNIMEKIEEKMKTQELHPWVKEFAGIMNKEKD